MISVSGNGKKGFTLIELLIVVAIIAILAAIAVPNFLEAQTRSKVSRLKSDMRTAATGIESYAVDYGRPPFGSTETVGGVNAPPGVNADNAQCRWFIWSTLTTPVAYLTSPVHDPFNVGAVRIAGTAGNAPGRETLVRFDAVVIHKRGLPDTPINGTNFNSAWDKIKSKGYTWYMFSLGPSRRWNTYDYLGTWIQGALNGDPDSATKQPRHPSMYYDPSNGTISFGWIVRSNKGQEPVK